VKSPSPLLGFNNNVRHRGRVFHIQTEDSGIRHPHIITHLFADGGRILKTIKTSYAEHVGEVAMTETVRGMMQEQHKGMFIALKGGEYDYLLEEPGSRPDPAARAVRDPLATTAELVAVVAEQVVELVPPPPKKPSRPELHIDPAAILGATARDRRGSAGLSEMEPLSALFPASGPVPRIESRPPASGLVDLPPPPQRVLGLRDSESRPKSMPAPRPTEPESTRAPVSRGGGRYAQPRAASFFSSPPDSGSLFGEDPLGEKSLDEIILAYLAEDLESMPPSR
jgi:hypothetical protein